LLVFPLCLIFGNGVAQDRLSVDIAEEDFHLIIMDLQMQEQDGLTTTCVVRECERGRVSSSDEGLRDVGTDELSQDE
jgi:CheY-like chemotaxis protein